MMTQSSPDVPLHRLWLWLARLFWLAIFLLMASIFVKMIPYSYHITYGGTMAEAYGAVTQVMPFDLYVRCLVVLEYLVAMVYILTAVIIFWRKSNDCMAIFVSATLLLLSWVVFNINGFIDIPVYASFLSVLASWLPDVLICLILYSFMLLFFLFPDGRFVPGWMKWIGGAIALWFVVLWSDALHSTIARWFTLPEDWAWLVVTRGVPGAIILGLGSQIYRYWRVSNAIERQQSKWVLFGLAAPFLHLILFISFFGQASVDFAIDFPLSLLIDLLIPLTIAFSIFRYRLWDIDLLINRTLVYGALTGLVASLYVLGVGMLGALAQRQNNLAISLLAAAVVGSMMFPLRNRLQALVNRYMPIEPKANSRLALLATNTAPIQPSLVDAAKADKPPQAVRNPPWKFLTFFGLYTVAAILWLLIGLLPGLAAIYPALLQGLRQDANSLSSSVSLEHWFRIIIIVSFNAVPPHLILFQYLFSLLNLALGITLVYLRPYEPVARWLALAMVGTAAVFNLQAHSVLNFAPSLLLYDVHELFHLFAGTTYMMALLLFPDGALPPWPFPRWRFDNAEIWLLRAFLTLLLAIFGYVFISVLHAEEPADFVAFFGVLVPVVGITAQSVRYRQATTAQGRRQYKTLILALALGFALAVVIGLFTLLLSVQSFHLSQQTTQALENIAFMIFPLLFTMIPISLSVIILRYRLWELDVLINRSLVYGTLTGVIIVLYILIVGVFGILFQAVGNLLLSVLATGLIAIGIQPLRQRLQQGVNRLMYGDRDDPVTVLASLGKRLEAATTPEAVLPAIVETIAQALKLPYTAIAIKQGDRFIIVATHGQQNLDGESIPLIYEREIVGYLNVARRAPGEIFSQADQRLLKEVAHKAGTAVQAARLTADLQQSRERLVTAREEERRRLRRDLHDGLGPQLASMSLKLDAARNLLVRDPTATDQLLVELKQQTQAALADIRRVVYALRPAALDQLGLLSALREYAASCTVDDLQVIIEAPNALPPLSAAIEVATYRIAVEAITNVVRHARANQCIVRLAVNGDLKLEISDDGQGLPVDYKIGVGLLSMRERAAELGGTCVIDARDNGGTRVAVSLPLTKES